MRVINVSKKANEFMDPEEFDNFFDGGAKALLVVEPLTILAFVKDGVEHVYIGHVDDADETKISLDSLSVEDKKKLFRDYEKHLKDIMRGVEPDLTSRAEINAQHSSS